MRRLLAPLLAATLVACLPAWHPDSLVKSYAVVTYRSVITIPALKLVLKVRSVGAGSVLAVLHKRGSLDKTILILTAEHVVRDAPARFTVTLNGATGQGRTLYASRAYDLALVVVKAPAGTRVRPVSLVDHSIRTGDKVWTIGAAIFKEYGPTMTSGEISSIWPGPCIDTSDETKKLFEFPYGCFTTSARVGPGNSGGGLFDEHGHLVGVVSMMQTRAPLMGIFVGSERVKEFLLNAAKANPTLIEMLHLVTRETCGGRPCPGAATQRK